ncbi:MerR family transcriptional regulator, partial [Streptomyces sp. NPDC059122]|uniref:MerR family transcriptional regulator n=1 Tax=Streptomyces sp. NPDC059122 TaxID=3346732 RepID=UPI00367C7B4C
MDDDGELLSIGAFARRAGLTPSALRFYGDCGVLRPDRVDAATGYRRYGTAQVARAVRLRHLRAAGLPVGDVGDQDHPRHGLAPQMIPGPQDR